MLVFVISKIPLRRKWQPTPVFLPGEFLGNFKDRGAWQATVHGVTKSQTQLSDSHIKATVSCDSFTGFPCFWWSLQFWELVSYFVECLSIGICLMFFSWLNLGCWFLKGSPKDRLCTERSIWLTADFSIASVEARRPGTEYP